MTDPHLSDLPATADLAPIAAPAAVDPALLVHVVACLGATFDPVAPRRDALLEHLHRLDDADGVLRAGALAALAQAMQLPFDEVVGVARSHPRFTIVADDTPAPELTVRVCTGVACMLAGGDALLAGTRAVLGDSIRVAAAPCLGRCHAAPVAVAGERPVHQASAERIAHCVETGAVGAPEPLPDDLPVDADMWLDPASPLKIGDSVAPRFCCFTTYRSRGGYALWQACLRGAQHADAIIEELDHAGLHGLGGADFAVARKWRAVRDQPGSHYLVVNVDENEPGTFKDRFFLERDPHRFLEGMLIASWVIGAQACYVYLRDEYTSVRGMLAREIARLREAFGNALPEIELRRGGGAYVCGDESALLESLEGRRAMPRTPTAAPAEAGLFGRPTLVSNLETLYWIRDIVEHGGAWYARAGRRGYAGLRAFSVSGRVREPGLFVAPAGITLRELIDEYADGMLEDHELYAFVVGGASGGILPASFADLPLDFGVFADHGAALGSGAIVVLSQVDSVREVAQRIANFFAHEACGRCAACTEGTARAARLLAARPWDQAALDQVAAELAATAQCALGRAAPNAWCSALRYFATEL